MDGKARFIFPVVITAIIVFVVSGVVAGFNIGLRADFGRAASPLSSSGGRSPPPPPSWRSLPVARSVTLRIVGVIEGAA